MNFKILDTGYLSNTTLTNMTQIARASRAGYNGSNAVKAFDVQLTGISRTRMINTDNKPVINNQSKVSTNLVSIRNPTMSFNIQISSNESNTGYETNFLVQLLRLEITYGLKLLYPTSKNTTEKTIIELLGEVNENGNFSSASPDEDAGTIPQNIPYLIGRIKFGAVPDSNNDQIVIIPCTFEASE